MKKILKSALFMFLIMSFVVSNYVQIDASTKEDFISTVEQHKSFAEYKDVIRVEPELVETDTEEGYRQSLIYNLKQDGTDYLMYIGDENNILIDAIRVIKTDEEIRIVELLKNGELNVITYNFGTDTNCTTYICTQTKKVTQWNYDGICSNVVGQTCSYVKGMPGKMAIWYFLCRGIVAVSCTSVKRGEVCTAGRYDPVCPM